MKILTKEPILRNQMFDYILQKHGNRIPRSPFTGSSMPYCTLRLWFQKQDFKTGIYTGEPINERMLLNFRIGDHVELDYVSGIVDSCVGPGKLYKDAFFGDAALVVDHKGWPIRYFKQPEWSFQVDDLVIKCHPDGYALRNLDGVYEGLEIKSANDFSVDRFKEEGPTDYRLQITAYTLCDQAKVLGITQFRVLYGRKLTGEPYDMLVEIEDSDRLEVIEKIRKVAKEEKPPRDHELEPVYNRGKLTGHKLPWQCSYCPYKFSQCWKENDFTKVMKSDQHGNSKPTYIKNNERNENEIQS